MKKFIRIVHYVVGESEVEQINSMIDEGEITSDTRLFFANNNTLSMGDLKKIARYFDLVTDEDFDGNVVLKPKEYFIRSYCEQKRHIIE